MRGFDKPPLLRAGAARQAEIGSDEAQRHALQLEIDDQCAARLEPWQLGRFTLSTTRLRARMTIAAPAMRLAELHASARG